MKLLNLIGLCRRDNNAHIAKLFHRPAIPAAQPYRDRAAPLRRMKGTEDVSRVSRSADSQYAVAAAGIGVYLLGEHKIRVHIIGVGAGQG